MPDTGGASLFGGDPEVIVDPYPLYEAARAEGPVVQEASEGVFLVTGFEQVLDVAARHDEFSSVVSAYGPWATEFLPKRPDGCPFGSVDLTADVDEWKRTTTFGSIPVVTFDPPYHSGLRTLVNRLFTPARLREIEPNLAVLAKELVDGFAAAGSVDFIAEFAAPYPFSVINEVFGVPREDWARLRSLYRSRSTWDAPDDPTASLRAMRERIEHEGRMAVTRDAMSELDLQFLEYMRDRRERPRGDTMSDIATARFPDGSLPTLEELVHVSKVVYGAGHNTTSLLLASAMYVLATQPQLQRELRAAPGRIPMFVDEVLRFLPASQGMFRYARRDATVAGVEIPAGSIVWLLWAAANRDPAKFDDPNTFDPNRSNARHALSFGHGIHFCPGQPLARLESRIAFTELLARLDDIVLDPDAAPVRWAFWFVLRGPDRLNISFSDVAAGS